MTVVKSIEEVEHLRPAWEEMQRSEPYPVINADIDRYVSVIEAIGDDVRPHVILINQNGRPAAMLIGRVEKHQLKLKLGYKTLVSPRLRCLTIEYGGVIGQPTTNLCELLVHELMKALRHEVDMVFFNHLRTDSLLYPFAQKMPGVLSRGYLPRIEPHWVMAVPESIDLFYQSLRPKSRNTLRRKIRKLEREFGNQVRIVTYRGENELEEAISAASQISHWTYQYALDVGFVDNAQTRGMMATAANRGWLRMSVLYVKSEPCAFQLVLQYRNTYFLGQTGFNPKWKQWNIGTALFLKVLENICNDPDVESFDFGFGDADYKRHYGNEHWHEACVYIYAPRFYPILINLLHTLVMVLSIMAGYTLEKLGFLAWVKRRWRNVLQKYSKR